MTYSDERTRDHTYPINATCITAPCARGNFGADSDALSGADMYPASDAAHYMLRARMVFEVQGQISPACSLAHVAY